MWHVASDIVKGIRASDFACVRDGMTLRGRRFLPETGEVRGSVILCHGFLSNQQTMAGYAGFLAGRGWAAYTFDFIGGTLGGRSDGLLRDMTVLTEVDDLLAVMDLVTRERGSGKPLVLVGGSQGGFVAALTAARCPGRVDALILLFPALRIPEDARAGKMLFFTFDPAHIPAEIPGGAGGELVMSGAYPACVKDMDAYREIAGYHGRVLILHGDADEIVPLRYGERARQTYAAAGADCTLRVIHGGGHGFAGEQDEQAREAMAAFLTR